MRSIPDFNSLALRYDPDTTLFSFNYNVFSASTHSAEAQRRAKGTGNEIKMSRDYASLDQFNLNVSEECVKMIDAYFQNHASILKTHENERSIEDPPHADDYKDRVKWKRCLKSGNLGNFSHSKKDGRFYVNIKDRGEPSHINSDPRHIPDYPRIMNRLDILPESNFIQYWTNRDLIR